MGIFNFVRKRDTEKKVETEKTEPEVDDILLETLLRGETITREKAMTIPAVASAVDFLSSSVACMPIRLYKIVDGKVEEQANDNRIQLLNGDTEDTLDAFQMKKAMVEDYLLGKGGYAYIQKSKNTVTALKYVEDSYITVMKNTHPIHKSFYFQVYDDTYQSYEFIKLLRNTKDGASGVGLTVQIAKVLETAYSTLKYQLGLVKNGGNKKGYLQAEKKLGQDEIDSLKRAWKKLYSNNSENVVVLNNGLKFQESSNTSVEMQLDENKQTLTKEINSIFHITDDFDLTFKTAIFPIVKALETALNRDFLLEKEKGKKYFECDVKEIVKANLKERYEAYKIAKETGFKTLNEIRKEENLNNIDGLDVVNLGLNSVLYDINTQKYYTPNTDKTTSLKAESENTKTDDSEEIINEEGGE